MKRRRRSRSHGLAWDAWRLGFDSAMVVGLRGAKLAAGGRRAETEAGRMVSEKITAGFALQALALTGGLGATPSAAARKTLRHYAKTVRANRRRLGKS